MKESGKKQEKTRKSKIKVKCNECQKCGGMWQESYEEEELWVACEDDDQDGESGCGDWFHVRCTNLSSTTTAEDFEDISWFCEACVE